MPGKTILALTAGFIITGSAHAQWTDKRDPSVEGPPTIPLTEGRFNAALQYHTAWMLLEPVLEYAEFSPDELEAIDRGELPEAYARALENDQGSIALLIDATKLKLCDFGTRYEDGIGALLPHLAVMRNSAKLLVNDARRLKGSDMDAVAQRLAATIRLGEHASQSHTVIGSLVGVAIVDLARVETQKLLESDAINAAQAEIIGSALDRILTQDPFHSLDSLRTERTMMTEWIKAEFQGEDAGRRLAELLQFEDNDASPENKALRRMNGEEITTLTDDTARAYDELLLAWQAEDPMQELSRIEANLERGEYGLVTKLLLPAVQRFRQRLTDSLGDLRAFRLDLKAVPEG